MKLSLFISVILLFTFVSCNNKKVQNQSPQNVPKALENKSSSYELVSKRGYDDLVENLYKELVTKNVDLQNLEAKIDALQRSQNDSTRLFYEFREKNQSYYSSANNHVTFIRDSILKEKIKLLIATHEAKYNAAITKHTQLLEIIKAKDLSISDLHTILKIVKTLPLMEKYQKENLPDIKSLQGYINRQDQAIKLADTLSKN